MPFLVSAKALETTCPGLKVDPIDNGRALSAANGSPIQLIGSINLYFCFRGLGADSEREMGTDGTSHAVLVSGMCRYFQQPEHTIHYVSITAPHSHDADQLC